MSHIQISLTIFLYASTVIGVCVMAFLAFLACVAAGRAFDRWMRQLF